MSALPATCVPPPPLTVAKLRHDADQFNYLQSCGILGPSYGAIAEYYRHLASQLSASKQERREHWQPAELRAIGNIYNCNVFQRHAPMLAQPYGASWSGASVESRYFARRPNIVVIDDFLSAQALHSLRAYCLESTIWNSLRYSHGRLGALYRNGLRCPLLQQLADSLAAALPRLIGQRHPLTQLWAYKYPAHMPGDDVHADFAAVNVNFWITPDAANLDPASGGMRIYDVAAPPDWHFTDYNRRPALIRRYLAAMGARARYIPYRQNRAIIFDSDLFHGTAACHFRDDYESRRINITLLYGQRDADHTSTMSASTTASQTVTSATSFIEGRADSAFENRAWRSAALRRPRRS
ncbi:MAG: hypothetical protein K2P77_05135 [Burkholderiaceae bacterium]|nr:hypothetical protein [Burkholderiaceae bacterium]